jgi:uncharacterized Zn finger protein
MPDTEAQDSRARSTTKRRGLRTDAECPDCGCSRHIVEHNILNPWTHKRVAMRLCGYCGHVWEPGSHHV